MELGKSMELNKAAELGMRNLNAKLLHHERNMYSIGLGKDACHSHNGNDRYINSVVDVGMNVSIIASIPIPSWATMALKGSVAFLVLVSNFATNCLVDMRQT